MNPELISGGDMNRLIEDKASIATLANDEDKERYEKLDRDLYVKIDQLLAATDLSASMYFQSDDWWPNRLRGIEMAKVLYTDSLVKGLQSLLSGRFHDFRIIVHIYEDMKIGSHHVSSTLITKTKTWTTIDNLGT